jgi:hypothetical protein
MTGVNRIDDHEVFTEHTFIYHWAGVKMYF